MTGDPNDSEVYDATELIDRLADQSVVTAEDAASDLALTAEFRSDWRRRIDQVTGNPTGYLGLLVKADPESLSVDDAGEDGIAVRDESGSITRTVGEWPSEAALVADVAAFVSLDEWLPGWGELDGAERDELVARLRVFLESCPTCGGEFEEGAVPDEAATPEAAIPERSCVDCGAALF